MLKIDDAALTILESLLPITVANMYVMPKSDKIAVQQHYLQQEKLLTLG